MVLAGVDSQFFSAREPDADVNAEKNLSLGDQQVSLGAAQLCYRRLHVVVLRMLARWNCLRILIICNVPKPNGLQRGVGRVSAEVRTPLDGSSPLSKCIIVKLNG